MKMFLTLLATIFWLYYANCVAKYWGRLLINLDSADRLFVAVIMGFPIAMALIFFIVAISLA